MFVTFGTVSVDDGGTQIVACIEFGREYQASLDALDPIVEMIEDFPDDPVSLPTMATEFYHQPGFAQTTGRPGDEAAYPVGVD